MVIPCIINAVLAVLKDIITILLTILSGFAPVTAIYPALTGQLRLHFLTLLRA